MRTSFLHNIYATISQLVITATAVEEPAADEGRKKQTKEAEEAVYCTLVFIAPGPLRRDRRHVLRCRSRWLSNEAVLRGPLHWSLNGCL